MFAYKNRIIQNVGSVKAGWHIVAGNPAGVFGWWDGVTAEQNCLVAHRDGTNATLVKYVGATRTEVIAPTAVTYVAGRSIEIRRLSWTNTFQLFYNGTQVGANQTISDPEIINNGYFGTFSSYEGNQCVSFVVNPFAAATLDYTFIDDPLSDYVVEVGIESSLILDGNQLDMWYHHGAVTEYIYSTDPTMQTWSAPVQVLS